MTEQLKSKKKKVAAFIHEGMEILDFAGPVEVFTSAGFEVFTVGVTEAPIVSQNVVTITPRYSLNNCPKADIVVVFGGNSESASENKQVLEWLKERSETAELMFSVCTGAFFFAKAGLLQNKSATTFHSELERLKLEFPSTKIIDGVKYVDTGDVITAAGVSSGIDGALYVVQKISGKEEADKVAKYIEYGPWFH